MMAFVCILPSTPHLLLRMSECREGGRQNSRKRVILYGVIMYVICIANDDFLVHVLWTKGKHMKEIVVV